MSPITALKSGNTGNIHSIEGEGMLKSRLEAMGIRIGAKVRKISAQKSRGPVVFISGRTQVALGKSMASKIMIKEDDANERK